MQQCRGVLLVHLQRAAQVFLRNSQLFILVGTNPGIGNGNFRRRVKRVVSSFKQHFFGLLAATNMTQESTVIVLRAGIAGIQLQGFFKVFFCVPVSFNQLVQQAICIVNAGEIWIGSLCAIKFFQRALIVTLLHVGNAEIEVGRGGFVGASAGTKPVFLTAFIAGANHQHE